MKVFKNISYPGMVKRKKKKKKKSNISLSSSNLQDSFDTKIDPPHEMQFGKTLNLIRFL